MWSEVVYVFAALSFIEGFGLVIGYVIVTVPGEGSQQVAGQPGPIWVLVVGLALGVYGTTVVGTTQYFAIRHHRPILDPDPSMRHPLMRRVPPTGAVAAVALAAPLGLVSVLATGSAFRLYPAALAAALIVVALWQSLSSRSPAPQ